MSTGGEAFYLSKATEAYYESLKQKQEAAAAARAAAAAYTSHKHPTLAGHLAAPAVPPATPAPPLYLEPAAGAIDKVGIGMAGGRLGTNVASTTSPLAAAAARAVAEATGMAAASIHAGSPRPTGLVGVGPPTVTTDAPPPPRVAAAADSSPVRSMPSPSVAAPTDAPSQKPTSPLGVLRTGGVAPSTAPSAAELM